MSGELRLDGKVALVTGGAAGIGKAYCMLLASRGASVVVNGNHRPGGVGPEAEVAAAIRAAGGTAIGVNGSIADEASARRMVQAAIDSYGRLDILVNNAGNSDTTMLVQDAPDERLDAQYRVHILGTLRVTRAAWPHLVASGTGRILNTGSAVAFGALGPLGYEAAYGAMKAALFSITRQMAGAGQAHGIHANLVLPWAYTNMVAQDLEGTSLRAYMEEKFDPAKVASACIYLLHPECPVSGQFVSAAGDRVARVVFASSRGYHNADLTPEDVRDHWAEIAGSVDSDGTIHDMFEITGLQGEFRMIRRMVS